MLGKIVHKRYVLTFAVFLVFLISNTAIAYHHHPSDDLSHDDCPICATAHVSSFAVHDFSAPKVQCANITVSELTPREYHFFFNPLFLTQLHNRAPPF
jgi:hypothetical protein